MFASFSVIYLLLIAKIVIAEPILVSECAVLNVPFATFKLATDVVVKDAGNGFICFDITNIGITLDGNGYTISADSNEILDGVGVQYSALNSTIKNMHITGVRTGILANGKFGKIEHNTITNVVNGIDVRATNTEISHNTIKDFDVAESVSGIYIYFPAITPTAAFISISNNVISDIRGAEFALGIAVYYATDVFIAHNVISNLNGDITKKEIYIIAGEAEIKGNIFQQESMVKGTTTFSSALLLSCVAIMVSGLWFFSPAPSVSSSSHKSDPMQTATEVIAKEVIEKDTKEESTMKEEKGWESDGNSEEMEMDGADEVPKAKRFATGSSPSTQHPDL